MTALDLSRLHPQIRLNLRDWFRDRAEADLCEAPTEEADKYRARARAAAEIVEQACHD